MRHLLGLPCRPWEVGGWLLGYGVNDTIVVTHGTPPAMRGTAFGITISGKGHKARFDAAWAASKGRVTFLGDWHTHPGGAARPSSQDLRAMKQLAEDPDYGTPRPLIAIVATGRWPRLSRSDPSLVFYWRASDGDVHGLRPEPLAQLPAGTRSVPDWIWPREEPPPESRDSLAAEFAKVRMAPNAVVTAGY